MTRRFGPQNFLRIALMSQIAVARDELARHVQPRDDTERAIVNALGEISWDEAIEAIKRHRASPTVKGDLCP